MSGRMQTGGGSVMLDSGAGLIRHEVNVDYNGVEWSDDVVCQMGGRSVIGVRYVQDWKNAICGFFMLLQRLVMTQIYKPQATLQLYRALGKGDAQRF